MKRALVIVLSGVSLISVAYANPSTGAYGDQAAKQGTGSITVAGKTITLNKLYVQRIQTFKKLDVAVYYPSFVPARFSFSSVKFDPQGDKQNPDYDIEFRDQKHHSFTVASAYSGIGDDGDGDRTLKGRSKIFGPFTVDVYKPGSEGNGGKTVYYLSSWLLDKRMVRSEKKGLPIKDGRFCHFYGDGVTDKEAVAIVQSLLPVGEVQ